MPKILTSKQKEIIFDSVANVLDDLIEQFYDNFSFNQLFEDLDLKGEPDTGTTKEIENEVDKAYENYFKK